MIIMISPGPQLIQYLMLFHCPSCGRSALRGVCESHPPFGLRPPVSPPWPLDLSIQGLDELLAKCVRRKSCNCDVYGDVSSVIFKSYVETLDIV